MHLDRHVHNMHTLCNAHTLCCLLDMNEDRLQDLRRYGAKLNVLMPLMST